MNKEKKKEYNKEYYEKNKEKKKEYYKKNKEKIKEYHKEYQKRRCWSDITFKLTKRLRTRLYKAIKNNYKNGSAIKDLGCSISKLKKHIESKFYEHPETGEPMSWENWSYNGWHIDHIKPLSAFDLENREEFLEACHYTNLQPLWSEENLSKSCKLDWDNVEQS